MKHTYLWLLLMGLTSWLGCSAASTGQNVSNEVQRMTEASPTPMPNQEPHHYSKDLTELRVAFNRDKGKVRLMTLLSPT